jgi:hypothetical protein
VLGRTRDLDSAPLLIFCLNDQDLRVVKEARDALRFVSRKFDSFGPEIPEGTYQIEEFEAERRKAVAAWKAWYLSIRPDHQFDCGCIRLRSSQPVYAGFQAPADRS